VLLTPGACLASLWVVSSAQACSPFPTPCTFLPPPRARQSTTATTRPRRRHCSPRCWKRCTPSPGSVVCTFGPGCPTRTTAARAQPASPRTGGRQARGYLPACTVRGARCTHTGWGMNARGAHRGRRGWRHLFLGVLCARVCVCTVRALCSLRSAAALLRVVTPSSAIRRAGGGGRRTQTKPQPCTPYRHELRTVVNAHRPRHSPALHTPSSAQHDAVQLENHTVWRRGRGFPLRKQKPSRLKRATRRPAHTGAVRTYAQPQSTYGNTQKHGKQHTFLRHGHSVRHHRHVIQQNVVLGQLRHHRLDVHRTRLLGVHQVRHLVAPPRHNHRACTKTRA
jgi:hypothetical protein